MHCGFRPAQQAELVAWLQRERPERILFRTDNDSAFWNVVPHTMIFDVLDAEIVEHYQFEEQVGPYHVVRRGEPLPRTYHALIAPGARRPLEFGRAPYYLGRDSAAGMARVCATRPSLSPARRWYLEAKIAGRGQGKLVIRPKQGVRVASEIATEIEFELLSDETTVTYCFPLWNLCFGGDKRPEEVFGFGFEGRIRSSEFRIQNSEYGIRKNNQR